jgi:ADP-heptose:LPS heptosyltransferase
MNTGFSIQSYRNILIPRFDTFGDLVLVEGFVSAVLEMAPEACVTLLVRKGYDQLAEMFPRRLVWETTSINPYAQVPRQEELAPFVTSLRKNSYDLVLFTTYSRTWLDDVVGAATAPAHRVALGACEPMPAPMHASLDQLGIDFSFPVYDVVVEVEESAHETEKYQVLREQLAGEPRSLRFPQLLLSGELSESAGRVLAQRGLPEETYLLCAPAGTINTSIKAWPETHFAGLIVRIEQIFGIPALIAGHEKERSIVENVLHLAEEAGAHPRVWLGEDGEMPLAAALAGKSLFYLGNDTGLMHAAAAFERPVIAFFGGGTWPRFLPAARTGRVFVTPMPCFYCKWECVLGEPLCMRGISFEEVLPEIEQFLHDLRDGRQSFRVIEQKVPDSDLRDYFEQAVRRLDQLTRLLVESEKDRHARFEQITELTRLLVESEKDRRLVDAARDVFFKIETSRVYRLARAMGFFDGLERVIADFRERFTTETQRTQRKAL